MVDAPLNLDLTHLQDVVVGILDVHAQVLVDWRSELARVVDGTRHIIDLWV